MRTDHPPAAIRAEARRIDQLDREYVRMIRNHDRNAVCFVLGMLTGIGVTAVGLLL